LIYIDIILQLNQALDAKRFVREGNDSDLLCKPRQSHLSSPKAALILYDINNKLLAWLGIALSLTCAIAVAFCDVAPHETRD